MSPARCIARPIALLAATLALSGAAYLAGRRLVPILDPLDRAVSAAINPDAYVPLLDEFFRALTDYTNFLIAVPLVSLAVAAGLLRLAQSPPTHAARRAGLACGLWWLFVAVLALRYGDRAPLATVIGLAAIAPALIAIGALPPRLIPALDPKRWLTGLLAFEAAAMIALWASRSVWWNAGLVGANYVLLPALAACFGGAAFVFHRWDAAAAARYLGLFWLVIASVLVADFGATHPLKDAVARPRPLAEANAPWNEILRPIPEETLLGHSSYPSGHVAGTVSLLTPIFWHARRRRVRAGLAAWGALQGLSRIYTAAHFLSDCVAGAILGAGIGSLAYFLLGPLLLRDSGAGDQPARCASA